MLINLSNHPSGKWSKEQYNTAVKSFGIIADLSFPAIDPRQDSAAIAELAQSYYAKIMAVLDECANEPKPNAVHIMGEFTFVFKTVNLLKSSSVKCIASTSVRSVEEVDGKKIIEFNFIQFREY